MLCNSIYWYMNAYFIEFGQRIFSVDATKLKFVTLCTVLLLVITCFEDWLSNSLKLINKFVVNGVS